MTVRLSNWLVGTFFSARLRVGFGLCGVLLKHLGSWRKTDPGMSSAVVDGVFWRRKARVTEGADGNHNRLLLSVIRMEEVASAHRAEPEPELATSVSRTDVLGGCTRDPVRRGKGGQCCEHASGSALTGQAVTDANAQRLSVNLDAQLTTGADGCSRRHSASRVVPLPPN